MVSPSLILGAAGVRTVEGLQQKLDVAYDRGITTLDTARMYGDSEVLLGQVGASSRFTIHTKAPGGLRKGTCTKEGVVAIANQSLENLKTEAVDVYYLHAPDRSIPFEGTLAGIDELFKAGKFRRFGLSNFLAEEVEQVVCICKERGYVVPSVYQGNYSPVARRMEAELLPVLRKHKISFYAYSPIAGGFLAKKPDFFRGNDGGSASRWNTQSTVGQSPVGKLYNSMYKSPSGLETLRRWNEVADEEGVTGSELAFRWVVNNSSLDGKYGDAVIIGAKSIDQLVETDDGIKKGPLSSNVAAKIDGIWDFFKNDAPLDNFNSSSLSA